MKKRFKICLFLRCHKLICIFAAVIIILSAALTVILGHDNDRILYIGVMPDVDSVQVAVAASLCKNTELVLFTDAYTRSTAFRQGAVDICVSDMITAVCEITAGRKDKILTVTSGRYSLLSRYHTLSQAADSVAVSTGTVIEFAADEIFGENNYNAVTVMSLTARYSALLSDSVESAVLPEPYATRAESAGFCKVATYENSEIGILSCTKQAANEKRDLITEFLQAFELAAEICNGKPDSTELTEALEALSLNGTANLSLPCYLPPTLPSFGTIDKVAAYLEEKDICIPDKAQVAASLWNY